MLRIAGEVVVILVLVLANGALAGSEIALVSVGKARLRARAEAGDRNATVALELAEAPNRFLSTVQIGITFAGIAAGAWGATALAGTAGRALAALGVPAPRATAAGIVVVVAGITLLTLVIGELVPKRLAMSYPERVAVLRTPHMVPPWTPAFRVLERFQATGDHIAIVTGRGGRVEGLVTLNDLLENIVGDFPEPHELPAPGAARRADGSWLMDGLLPLDECLSRLGREPVRAIEFPTLHAFVIHHLGDEPATADAFEWNGLRFEVVDMDDSRVDKVLIDAAAGRTPLQ
jgi:CBS domain containing-hemolysin-like protein